MKGKKRKIRVLAAALTAGILFCMQGITVYAGTTGAGSFSGPHGGPGAVNWQEEQAGQSQGQQPQEQTGQSQVQQPKEQANQGQGRQPKDLAGQNQGQQPAQPETRLEVNYSGFAAAQGWTAVTADNGSCVSSEGVWITAMKANLIQIPQTVQVGIRYQVNLSGSGWLDWAEDGEETGNTAGIMPLEAIRMELTGSGAMQYDLYYRVLQNGAWTGWAANGLAAGVEGAGLRIDGFRASITPKGAGVPPEPAPVLPAIDPSRPMIALTFDDGPRTSVTSRILDSLQANGGKATFFIVGSNVNNNAGVVKRMVEQGCEVANHTHDHKYITKISDGEIVSQLAATNQKIEAACGASPVLMRPPGGYINAHSLSVVKSLGMTAIMWSIDTRDWQHRNAQKTIDTVLSQVRDGDIILMHDIYSTSADAAVVLIPELTARGYQLVTVSELAAYRGGAAAGHKYSQFR